MIYFHDLSMHEKKDLRKMGNNYVWGWPKRYEMGIQRTPL